MMLLKGERTTSCTAGFKGV